MSFAPAWGETVSGVERLWESGATDLTLYDVPGTRLDSRFGYSFGVFRGRGVLTPYADVSLASEAAQGYRLGGLLAVGRSATVSLEVERREHAIVPIIHVFMVRGVVRF